jgi:hydrogenase expression/formation protein HypE
LARRWGKTLRRSTWRRPRSLVVASDPITLAADSVPWYVVVANANDVAASGATPRWLVVTLLFPPGSTPSEIAALVRDIHAVCSQQGVTLCGGHTEVTDAVTRPLAVGTMAGAAPRRALRDKRRMQRGDRILLTKRVAVEGTGLLAREYGDRLAESGMTAEEIAECARFLERMSVVEEAAIAREFAGVTAMHDVTEGGLATAVRELGAAGGRRLRLHLDRIPLYPETERVCAALGLDPLGLIGSGSLLLVCAPSQTAALAAALGQAGIEVTDIGEVLEEGEGVEALAAGTPAEWPTFERDEVSRLSSAGGAGALGGSPPAPMGPGGAPGGSTLPPGDHAPAPSGVRRGSPQSGS